MSKWGAWTEKISRLARDVRARRARAAAPRVARLVTVNKSVEEVTEAWRSTESQASFGAGRLDSVSFAAAPGGRGTEVRVEVSYDLGRGGLAAIARTVAEAPSRSVEGYLRRFKQLVETGDVLMSDASVRRGLHPAQPSQPSEEASR